MDHLWLLLFFLTTRCSSGNLQADDNRRPIQVIGHMVNSIEEIVPFLQQGSNALELDIQFNADGTVRRVYHGPPCDCVRNCTKTANLAEYLDFVRTLARTDPIADNLLYLYFDLKLSKVPPKNRYKAGQDMADHVLGHLWGTEIGQPSAVEALVYIENAEQNETIIGFRNRFFERGHGNLLENVAFDGGFGPIDQIAKMWQKIGVTDNVIQEDGITNCFSAFYPDHRLRNELKVRDTPHGYIDKVHQWTIDDITRMRRSLNLGVDGMITNEPKRLVGVLGEAQFSKRLRLATKHDKPFEKFITNDDTYLSKKY